ncbi:MAG: hypothetical protein ABIV06_02315 [Thermoanaerobaculia bacterium]
MIRTACRLLLCAFVVSTVAYGEAATTFYGTTQGQPTFNRPSDLVSLSGAIVRYHVQPFFPNADSDCFIQSVQEGGFDGYVLLYRNGFNPANPLATLVDLDDDGPEYGVGESRLPSRALLFNDNYYLVTTAYNEGTFGTFSNQVICENPATRVLVGDDSFGTGQTSDYDGRRAQLLGGRFEVSVTGFDFAFTPFVGKTVPMGSSDSAIFYFFQPANFELLIKMVNACGLNSRYWVYYAATTNVDFTITVEDTFASPPFNIKTYHNSLGTQERTSVADSNAFATCF